MCAIITPQAFKSMPAQSICGATRCFWKKWRSAFPESTDVDSVMHHILDTLLGEAMKQLNNPRAGNDEIAREEFQAHFQRYQGVYKK